MSQTHKLHLALREPSYYRAYECVSPHLDLELLNRAKKGKFDKVLVIAMKGHDVDEPEYSKADQVM